MSVGGILTAVVTPFARDGSVNEGAFVALLRHLEQTGSDGVVVAGTTGESPTLTDEEKLRLFELAVGEKGDLIVIAGTGNYNTADSVRLTEKATDAGVDAVLAVTPYYNKPNRRGLIAHYEAIAGATDRPVILYNIPSRCVIDIPNELLAELAQIEHVDAVKQANPDNLAPIDGLDLLAGNDDMLADVMDIGGTGGILVAAQIVGKEMRRIIDEPENRRGIERSLMPLYEALSVTSNPMPVKTAMNLLGHNAGGFRLPLVEVSDDELATIRGALEQLGLLSAAAA